MSKNLKIITEFLKHRGYDTFSDSKSNSEYSHMFIATRKEPMESLDFHMEFDGEKFKIPPKLNVYVRKSEDTVKPEEYESFSKKEDYLIITKTQNLFPTDNVSYVNVRDIALKSWEHESYPNCRVMSKSYVATVLKDNRLQSIHNFPIVLRSDRSAIDLGAKKGDCIIYFVEHPYPHIYYRVVV